MQDETLRSDQPLTTIDTLAAPMLVPIGEASIAAPLFRVTVVETGAMSFALVVSMSHVLADGGSNRSRDVHFAVRQQAR